jgi:lysozyme
LKTSSNGRKFIENFEGLVLVVSDDGFGTPTGGYGHTNAAGPPPIHLGQHLTQSEADEWLANDLSKVEQEIDLLVKVPLNQNQFDALVSWEFNLGSLRSSSVLQFLNQGNYKEASNRMLLYNHANGRVVAGLTRRRQAEVKMFLTPTTNVPTQPPHQIPTPIPAPQSTWMIIFNFINSILTTLYLRR